MKYVKYRTQKQQVSYDGGETWEDTGETRKGEYLGVYDTEEDCANATVPSHDVPVPQANPGAKATLILDDGEEVDLPFTGWHTDSDRPHTGHRAVDDYVFTSFDVAMTFTSWSEERRDYIAQHCVKIILSDQITCVCKYLSDGPYGLEEYYPSGMLEFHRSTYTGGTGDYHYYNKLKEFVIQDSTTYVGINGSGATSNYGGWGIVLSRIRLPQNPETLMLCNLKYIEEFTVTPSVTKFNTNSTYNKVVCYTDNFCIYSNNNAYAIQKWDSYLVLLYGDTVPSSVDKEFNLGHFVYVRDELVRRWHTMYVNSRNERGIVRVSVNIFFPLSIYNVDFREPNENEKFVARLSDGTLYSIPLGNGIVSRSDVESIWGQICDIKFGSGVTKIGSYVFGYENVYDSSNLRHNINLLELNSDVDLSECGVQGNLDIDKIKLNGNNFFNCLRTASSRALTHTDVPLFSASRKIFVPDSAFESYVKLLPSNGDTRADSWRCRFRLMSSFKIND